MELGRDMTRSERLAPLPMLTDLIMRGLILAALIKQAAQNFLKRSTPCFVGTRNPAYAMPIFPIYHPMI